MFGRPSPTDDIGANGASSAGWPSFSFSKRSAICAYNSKSLLGVVLLRRHPRQRLRDIMTIPCRGDRAGTVPGSRECSFSAGTANAEPPTNGIRFEIPSRIADMKNAACRLVYKVLGSRYAGASACAVESPAVGSQARTIAGEPNGQRRDRPPLCQSVGARPRKLDGRSFRSACGVLHAEVVEFFVVPAPDEPPPKPLPGRLRQKN
jgi:hypothetical protein